MSTTRTVAQEALSPSATVLGAALAASCLLHGAVFAASLTFSWPSYVLPVVAVFPVEIVESIDEVPAPTPRVVPPARPPVKATPARVAAPRATPPAPPAPASESRSTPQVPPELASVSRDVEPAQPEPLKQTAQEVPSVEVMAPSAASSERAAGTQSLSMSGATVAESGEGITARAIPTTRERVSSGAAAANGPMAAVPPNSAPLARITQAARPGGGYQVRPTYPPAARRAGAEGTTLLRVHVLDDGRIGEVRVERSAGHVALDEAAADAVRKWHFEPARSGSDTVAVWVLIPVEFRLRSGL